MNPAPSVGERRGETIYRRLVDEFRRRVIAHELSAASGNVTHAAAALGLQRTYVQRLIVELGVTAPRRGRRRTPASDHEPA